MCNHIERDLLAAARRAQQPAHRRINSIISHAIAVATCGVIVSACSGKPNIDLSALKSAAPTEQVSIESSPPGADARTPAGATCRTPCTLGVPMSDSSITVALNGYTPQTVPVQLDRPADARPEEFTQQAHLTPNPVFVELQAAPPSQVKKPAPKKPKVVAHVKPAAERSAQTTSTASPAPEGAAMAPPPWPAPPR
ncbi:MAG: PEGA domain-containing protein [Bradyrhizobiaceae bacterium]|nr:PEGA domain-containing protein [Bradyrhizobiaceae bacterium]